jgi:hypothetical protein
MLLPSKDVRFNLGSICLLIVGLFSGTFILTSPTDVVFREIITKPNQVGDGTREENRDRSIGPSIAPVVAPPTIPSTYAPTSLSASSEDKFAQKRQRRQATKNQVNLSLPFDHPQVIKPVDEVGNSLPGCDDPKFNDGTMFGSYSDRGYTYEVASCFAGLSDEEIEFGCTGPSPKHNAASYTSDGSKICRCGGIALDNRFCAVARSMKFSYNERFVDDSQQLTTNPDSVCGSKTKWQDGRFLDGRYVPPGNCSLLDMNPRSIVKLFPQKLIFVDGDSHQQDKIWGFIAEVRNQRLTALPVFGGDFAKDIRYEVSAEQDWLDLDYFGKMDFGDPSMRTCKKTKSPCTVFIYRFDRGTGDYIRSANSVRNQVPDYLIAGFISRTYSANGDLAQLETKAVWESIIQDLNEKPISIAWTSFPMNSEFVVNNQTDWINGLGNRFKNVKHHFALLDSLFYDALKHSSGEPGRLTLTLTWHDSCHINGFNRLRGSFDAIDAAELCVTPVAKLLYRAMLSLFAQEPTNRR